MVLQLGVSSSVSSIYVVGSMEDGWPQEFRLELMQAVKHEVRLLELRLLIETICPDIENGYEIAEAIIDVVDHEKLTDRLRDIQKKNNDPDDD